MILTARCARSVIQNAVLAGSFFELWLARLCALSLSVSMLVNGVETEAQTGVLALLEKLHIDPGTVAVLVNGDIVPREDWAERTLASADEIEIVKFVGGG